jgi:hypothetical protein
MACDRHMEYYLAAWHRLGGVTAAEEPSPVRLADDYPSLKMRYHVMARANAPHEDGVHSDGGASSGEEPTDSDRTVECRLPLRRSNKLAPKESALWEVGAGNHKRSARAWSRPQAHKSASWLAASYWALAEVEDESGEWDSPWRSTGSAGRAGGDKENRVGGPPHRAPFAVTNYRSYPYP